jgi:hypothetical protein
MALDNAGNVYVTGRGNLGVDFATVKYDAFGTQQWVATYNGPASGSDEARAIAVDNAGNVVITGSDVSGGGPASVYSTVKYNAAGVQQWARNDNGPANAGDQAYDVAVDTSGNVYVTGQVSNAAYDVYTIKYNPSGALQWTAGYTSGGATSVDQGRFVKVDRSGNVFVTGTAVTPFVTSDYVTIKYTQGPTSVGDEGAVPAVLSLDQNYPNPFNPGTTIRYQLRERGNATLAVYNTLGEQIAVLARGAKEAGAHYAVFDAAGLPSGVYFYRLEAGGRTETRRMLLLR